LVLCLRHGEKHVGGTKFYGYLYVVPSENLTYEVSPSGRLGGPRSLAGAPWLLLGSLLACFVLLHSWAGALTVPTLRCLISSVARGPGPFDKDTDKYPLTFFVEAGLGSQASRVVC
jgi:hypothetical protein